MDVTREVLEMREELREMRREVRRLHGRLGYLGGLFATALTAGVAFWYFGSNQISVHQVRLGRPESVSVMDATKVELNGYQGRRIWINSNDASITFRDANGKYVRIYSEFGKLMASTTSDDDSVIKKRLF